VTTCDETRPLLPDHALGSLTDLQEGAVRRHLRGCASCRRELEALRDGLDVFASTLGRSPPPELRDRVLDVLASEWDDAVEQAPATTARTSRRWAGLAAAAIALAVVAGAAAVLQAGRADDVARDARRYRTVLATLGGTGFRVGTFEPAGTVPVSGSVVAYESSHDQSFVAVFVRSPGLVGDGELVVQRSDGTTWDPGPIEFDGDGDAAVWWVTDRSISSITGLHVEAPDGSPLANARVRPA
jgi:hypothetical protein